MDNKIEGWISEFISTAPVPNANGTPIEIYFLKIFWMFRKWNISQRSARDMQ